MRPQVRPKEFFEGVYKTFFGLFILEFILEYCRKILLLL